MNKSLIATAVLCAADMHAAQPIKTSLATDVPGCQSPKEVTVAFKVEKREDFTQAVQSRLVSIWKWFDAVSQVDPAPLVSFSVQPVDDDRKIIAVARVDVMAAGPRIGHPIRGTPMLLSRLPGN